VAGLRFAATRDLNAFLRNSESGRGNGNGNGNGHCNANDQGNGHAKCPHDTLGPANPLGDAVHYAIIYGSSQSGRWIRRFIELGFNENENENRVFDAAIPHKASNRGAFNVRSRNQRGCRERTGSFIPFIKTQAERLEAGDPRPSLAERYPTHADYVTKVTTAANSLVSQRLLLPEDAAFLIDQANAAAVP
jgi:hypothetical protein